MKNKYKQWGDSQKVEEFSAFLASDFTKMGNCDQLLSGISLTRGWEHGPTWKGNRLKNI